MSYTLDTKPGLGSGIVINEGNPIGLLLALTYPATIAPDGVYSFDAVGSGSYNFDVIGSGSYSFDNKP